MFVHVSKDRTLQVPVPSLYGRAENKIAQRSFDLCGSHSLRNRRTEVLTPSPLTMFFSGGSVKLPDSKAGNASETTYSTTLFSDGSGQLPHINAGNASGTT